MSKRICLLIALFTALVVLAPCLRAAAGEVVFQAADGRLTLVTPRWEMTLDAKTGALERLADRAAPGPLLRGGTDLWVIERHEASAIGASACTLTHRWDAARSVLTLVFSHPDCQVDLACTAGEEGPGWQPTVRLSRGAVAPSRSAVPVSRGAMLAWRFPARLEFDANGLRQFIFPEHLGLAFSAAFFAPGGAGVVRHPIGGRGLEQVAGDRCQMRPVDDAAVAARPGNDAADWLPAWYLKELPRWRVTANRAPVGALHELSLVETEHGSWLSGYRLGGSGWLFRLGGRLGPNDSRPRTASIIATLARAYRLRSASETHGAGGRIGLVLARPTGRPGGRYDGDLGGLLTELRQQDWVKKASLPVETIDSPAALAGALAAPERWFALINTVGEGFLAASAEDAEPMLAAIRQYVRSGGVWWEAGGGYPFYAAIVPATDTAFSSANRDFCDFAALESAEGGRWSCYGVQLPEAIFVPAAAEIGATGPPERRTGYYAHAFQAFAEAGATLRLPFQQMVLGRPHREVLADYGQRNGQFRRLEDKPTPQLIERLKRAVLVKVSTRRLTESTAIAEKLAHPVLFHIADYLRGGFDKQYPDHLPPRAEAGTSADLSALVEACQRRGHLFMPYTNPTWWCTNPKGPTFEREGEAPLARDLAGQIYPERYGEPYTQGYTITAWHPAVVKANEVIRRQFTEDYPVDVLFQDQVGARGHRWDTNPAAPHPGAYLEGIHRIAKADAAYVPLGTEDGHDRLINYETMFCGLSYPWLPNRPRHGRVLYEDLWPAGAWRIEPLALFLAHDKVLFYHHDLGGFVRNRLDLSLTLVMGYGLSWWIQGEPSADELDWLDRLCRLQAALGPQLAGRALDDFEYLAPQVIRSRWGELEIVANMATEPWPLDDERAIAPEGFAARSPGLEAGIFARHPSAPFSAAGHWLIRDRDGGEWSRGPEPAR